MAESDNFNHIVNDTVPQKVLTGQNLQFEGFDAPPLVYRLVSGDIENTYPARDDYRIYNVNWPTSGAYYVNYNSSTGYDAQLSVEDVNMPLEIKVDTKKVSSIAVGTNLTIDTGGMDLYNNDQVDLVVNELKIMKGAITFAVVFAIAGLLAVAYFLRIRKK